MSKILFIIFLFFLNSYSFSRESVTARDYYPVADSIARSLLDDLSFIIIRSDSVDLFGKAVAWDYAYQGLKISFTADKVIIDTTFGIWTGSSTIENDWFDSDSAFGIAEKNGGVEFRQIHPVSQIVMDLGNDSATSWTEWMVRYSSKRDLIYRYFYINAHTGEIIYDYTTSVIDQTETFSYKISQNYPNPFNAATQFEYTLPGKPAHSVEIKIFDVLGRQVKTLLKGIQPGGFYRIHWDGTDAKGNACVSGIYFVQFAVNRQRLVRKVSLIR